MKRSVMRNLLLILLCAVVSAVLLAASVVVPLKLDIDNDKVGDGHGWPYKSLPDGRIYVDNNILCCRYGEPVPLLFVYLPLDLMVGVSATRFIPPFEDRSDPPKADLSTDSLRISQGIYIRLFPLISVWLAGTLFFRCALWAACVERLKLFSYQRFAISMLFSLILILFLTWRPILTDFDPNRNIRATPSIHKTSFAPGMPREGTTEYQWLNEHFYGWPVAHTMVYELDDRHEKSVLQLPRVRLHTLKDLVDPIPEYTLNWDSVRISRGVYISALPFFLWWFVLTCVMLVPFNAARLVFRKRKEPHQCKSCGYDATGLEICPECGTQAGHQDNSSRPNNE